MEYKLWEGGIWGLFWYFLDKWYHVSKASDILPVSAEGTAHLLIHPLTMQRKLI